jgi:DNA-binding MarR family transcriptional regulator
MVRSIDGLNPTDVEILRFLAGHSFAHFEAGPQLTADHVGSSAATVSRRFDRLAFAGLVEPMTTHKSTGRHSVTELGRRYLAEDLTDVEAEALQEDVHEFIAME